MTIKNYSKQCLMISAGIMVLALLLSLFGMGINVGIDFSGGMSMQYTMGEAVTQSDVEGVLNGIGLKDYAVSVQGSNRDSINIRIKAIDEDGVQGIQASITEALQTKYPNAAIYGDVNYVGPVAGATLLRNAFFSVLIAALCMLIYIAIGFPMLILWFGAKNVLGTGWRAWDIGAFTTFLSCFTRLAVKSSKVAKLFNSVQKAEVSWKRIKPLMKSPEALDDLRIPQSADVTLDNLSFTYGDAPIFSGLSLTAHPGDIIGVTGPVACGKSTFGRVFLCEMPYGGSVRFGGKELSSFSPQEISGMVGYLGHDPELSMDTIQNNVLFGSRQDVLPRLNAVVLTDEVLAMENGADTVVGSSGARLSGGQAQRLALARTLAHPRPLMILDDPFSALDRKTEDAVFANLQAYAKDKVIFLISHRLYHFPQMQQVIFMEDGKTTVGTHDELMASVPTYRWLYESQTGGEGHA